jgi:hypothetical protein
MNTYTAKHNVKKHTVTIHAANCTCVASGSVWTVEANSPQEACEVAREDAPNVDSFRIAPCACSFAKSVK